jgi:hypothetical protein
MLVPDEAPPVPVAVVIIIPPAPPLAVDWPVMLPPVAVPGSDPQPTMSDSEVRTRSGVRRG